MVIPVHDVNPLRRTPWVTYALIAVNFVVFLLTPANVEITAEDKSMIAEGGFFNQS